MREGEKRVRKVNREKERREGWMDGVSESESERENDANIKSKPKNDRTSWKNTPDTSKKSKPSRQG